MSESSSWLIGSKLLALEGYTQTERQTKISTELFSDMDKSSFDFQNNWQIAIILTMQCRINHLHIFDKSIRISSIKIIWRHYFQRTSLNQYESS